MQLQYNMEIHRYPDEKKKKNTVVFGIINKSVSDWCCHGMKESFSVFIEISTSSELFVTEKRRDVDYTLDKPVLILKTFEEGMDCEFGNDEYHIPIKFCPFCAEEIIFELVEKKKITHTCKKVKKTYEECEDQKEEKVIFSKKQEIKK